MKAAAQLSPPSQPRDAWCVFCAGNMQKGMQTERHNRLTQNNKKKKTFWYFYAY